MRAGPPPTTRTSVWTKLLIFERTVTRLSVVPPCSAAAGPTAPSTPEPSRPAPTLACLRKRRRVLDGTLMSACSFAPSDHVLRWLAGLVPAHPRRSLRDRRWTIRLFSRQDDTSPFFGHDSLRVAKPARFFSRDGRFGFTVRQATGSRMRWNTGLIEGGHTDWLTQVTMPLAIGAT